MVAISVMRPICHVCDCLISIRAVSSVYCMLYLIRHEKLISSTELTITHDSWLMTHDTVVTQSSRNVHASASAGSTCFLHWWSQTLLACQESWKSSHTFESNDGHTQVWKCQACKHQLWQRKLNENAAALTARVLPEHILHAAAPAGLKKQQQQQQLIAVSRIMNHDSWLMTSPSTPAVVDWSPHPGSTQAFAWTGRKPLGLTASHMHGQSFETMTLMTMDHDWDWHIGLGWVVDHQLLKIWEVGIESANKAETTPRLRLPSNSRKLFYSNNTEYTPKQVKIQDNHQTATTHVTFTWHCTAQSYTKGCDACQQRTSSVCIHHVHIQVSRGASSTEPARASSAAV